MRWAVIFCDPEPIEPGACRKDRWLYWLLVTFLKPGFRHVYAMRRAEAFDGWLVINPASDCMDVVEVAGDDYLERVVLPATAKGFAHVVFVEGLRPKSWVPRGLFSCVAAISHAIGAECGITATPWRLYRNLVPRGEGSMMGGIFGGGAPAAPVIDTSAADERARKAEEERDRLKKENDAKVRNRRNRSRGRSLLAFDETGMTGVPGASDKLGQ